jgi:hypothetical protein
MCVFAQSVAWQLRTLSSSCFLKFHVRMTDVSSPQRTRFHRNPFSNSGDRTRRPTDIYDLFIILSFYAVCIYSLRKTPNSALSISLNKHKSRSPDFKVNLYLPRSNDDLMLNALPLRYLNLNYEDTRRCFCPNSLP